MKGAGFIPSGKSAILEIPGEAHILSALGADEFGTTFDIRIETTTKVEALPDAYALFQNNPNPFNPTTTISFNLASEGQVRLAVYNITGQRVKTLLNGPRQAGLHNVVWDGRDESGNSVASGIYFYRMETADYTESKQMVLLK